MQERFISDYSSIKDYPKRIVCLTEESTETIYLLGQEHRIVGVSGYTVRPPQARLKPKVSAFIRARFDKILALEPDLVFAFSDLQADIAAELIRSGLNVVTFNQRSIREILEVILTIGRILGVEKRAADLVASFEANLKNIAYQASQLPFRPRIYFEEWPDPLISGICWVDELIEIAGGKTIFPELRSAKSGKERIVSPQEVINRDPEIIIASWCGRKVNRESIMQRPGWDKISAIAANQVFEIKSTIILQPGPAALTDGLQLLHKIISSHAARLDKKACN
ncbi:MAG TPA: cobalamin-binding protein [Pyrinomonadaceae bacterium]|nr:cobalamin-binding protein [Pyrinomonadaceae bacterium]